MILGVLLYLFVGLVFAANRIRNGRVSASDFIVGLYVILWPLVFPYLIIIMFGKLAEKISDL